MNVYDFDGTIYQGDSSVDFFLYCLKCHPRLFFYVPYQLKGFFLYGLKIINKTMLKEYYFSFLKGVASYNDEVAFFWAENERKIKRWYLNRRKPDDVIISASPEFLLKPICKALGVNVIGSIVNPVDGSFLAPNCHGKEKVKRFEKAFPEEEIEEFYSDSESDKPMMLRAKEAYIVKRNGIILRWNGVE